MPSGGDSLPTAVLTAVEQDLKPLAEESAEALCLDERRLGVMDDYLRKAWFFGIKTGHNIIAEAKMGQSDPKSVLLGMQDELQELMEACAETLNLTIPATIAAWSYLGDAWIAGAKFWEVEIAARLIEHQAGDFDEVLRRLEE